MIVWNRRGTLSVIAALAVIVLTGVVLRHELTRPAPTILDVGPERGNISRPVSLRGAIDFSMYERVASALASGSRHFTIDRSFGGNPMIAAIIASTISGKDGSLTATGICYSACALLLIGVKKKYYTPEADIQVHGARYRNPAPGQDPDQPARDTVAYLISNGTPPQLAQRWGFAINLHRLTPDELALVGVSLRAQPAG